MANLRNILRISDEKTIELLELYGKEECLWNTALDEYKMRDCRTKAARSIANKLDLQNFEAKHVMMKFKNIRSSYQHKLKKMAASRASGVPEEEQYKPKVFWFSKIDCFLRPHLQRSPKNAFLFDQDSFDPIITSVKSEVSFSECSEEPASYVQSSSEDEAPPKPKRRKKSTNDEVDRILSSMLTSPQLPMSFRHDDQYDCFGKYIASLLRSMPEQRALELQPRIVSMVTSAAGAGEASVSQSDAHNLHQ